MEEGAEEQGRHRPRSVCSGTREAEAEGVALRRLPIRAIAEREKPKKVCLEAEVEDAARHRPRSACLGARGVEAEGPARHRPPATFAPDYPGVFAGVVLDSPKEEMRQRLALTN